MAADILMNFDFSSDGLGTCPVCHKKVYRCKTQLIKHYQCSSEVEVCLDCKSDFIKINDIFFRGVF